jgi:hypothetical protein
LIRGTPNAILDFSDRVPAELGHGALATIDANGFRNDGVPPESLTASSGSGCSAAASRWRLTTSNRTTLHCLEL